MREVLGCELPEIDQFQKHRAIIGIPRKIISDIIHEGNSIRLSAEAFRDGAGMSAAFDMTLQMIRWDVNVMTGCFAGIFIGRNVKITRAELAAFTAHLDEALPKRTEPFWGFYISNDLPDSHGQIITVATSRHPSEASPTY